MNKTLLNNYSKIIYINQTLDTLRENIDYFILEKNDFFVLAIDLLKIIRLNKHRKLHDLFQGDIEEVNKKIKLIYNKVLHITPTTFLMITNIKKDEWFNDDSIVKNIIDTFPEYNFVFEEYDEFDYEAINKKNQYFFNSTAYDVEEWRFYNQIIPNNKIIGLYTIVRYPKLLEVFDDNRKEYIPFLLPLNSPELENLGEYVKVTLNGFKPSDDLTYFVRNLGGSCECAMVKEINFEEFFDIEVTFNLFNVFEGNRIIHYENKDYQALFFYSNNNADDNKYPKTKEHTNKGLLTEDFMATDIYTILPIHYDNLNILEKYRADDNNFMVNNILTGLGFQENFEFGNQNRIIRKFHERVKFFDLGTINILTTDEAHYNYYIKHTKEICSEKPIPVRIIVLADEDTHNAVLMMCNLAVKGKPGDYLDEISRNYVMITPNELIKQKNNELIKEHKPLLIHQEDNIEYTVFYNYLLNIFHIKVVGTPRSLILSSFLVNNDDESLKAAAQRRNAKLIYGEESINNLEKFREQLNHIKTGLLYGVSIYTDAEELGKIIDKELLEYIDKPYGDAIYDYSSAYYSNIIALLYDETYMDYIVERIDFGVVDLMYLVLLQFEDSAIENASTAISGFINYYQVKGARGRKKRLIFAENTLDSIDKIYEEYSLTLDFWGARSNYNSSNKVLEIMRERFKIQEDIDRLNRNTQAMRDIYSAKQNRSSRITAILVEILGFIFTLQSLADLFSKIVEDDDLSNVEKLIFQNIDALLLIRLFLGILLIFIGTRIVINLNNRKNR